MVSHLLLADSLKALTDAAGANNFAADPITISMFGIASRLNTLEVVEISNPKQEGLDLDLAIA